MKIKRFQAVDMRQALRQVRDELGADAVILSNRKIDDGIELVAAVDFDEAAFAAQEEAQAEANAVVEAGVGASKPQQPAASELAEGYNWRGGAADHRGSRQNVQPIKAKPATRQAEPGRQRQRNGGEPVSAGQINVVHSSAPEKTAQSPRKAVHSDKGEADNVVLLEMRREMESIRRMMRNEFSLLGWEDMGRKQPDTQELFRRLMSLDLSADLCHGLARKVEEIGDVDKSWRKALAILAASLPVFQGNILDEGGVVALVGPTGVGKTTSIAKLAARFCLRHGNRHLGLITADGYRLGGQDQLIQYARLLDVPVRSANTLKDLEIALNAFADKRLILVDTAGMSQRDARLQEQLAFLNSDHRQVRTFLALASNTQQAALEQAIMAFGQVKPEGCIITKVDEAASLGGVFSALIRQGMPLAYIADGQKVPEDLHLPRTQALVNRAVNMSQQYVIGQSEQYMALSLGGVSADARA
jgi:flagellar biosynthesis protein FlhF